MYVDIVLSCHQLFFQFAQYSFLLYLLKLLLCIGNIILPINYYVKLTFYLENKRNLSPFCLNGGTIIFQIIVQCRLCYLIRDLISKCDIEYANRIAIPFMLAVSFFTKSVNSDISIKLQLSFCIWSPHRFSNEHFIQIWLLCSRHS